MIHWVLNHIPQPPKMNSLYNNIYMTHVTHPVQLAGGPSPWSLLFTAGAAVLATATVIGEEGAGGALVKEGAAEGAAGGGTGVCLAIVVGSAGLSLAQWPLCVTPPLAVFVRVCVCGVVLG